MNFPVTGWGPRTLIDLDYSWCCLCCQYTRDVKEHTKNHCEVYFTVNYRTNATKDNPLFDIKRRPVNAHSPYTCYAETRQRKAEEEMERQRITKELDAEAKKAWIESRKALKQENARIRKEAKLQAEKEASKLSKFDKKQRKIAKQRIRHQCKRVGDNARDDNEPKTKHANTQTYSTSSDDEELMQWLMPKEQTKITEFFKPIASTTHPMAESQGSTTHERDEVEVIDGKSNVFTNINHRYHRDIFVNEDLFLNKHEES